MSHQRAALSGGGHVRWGWFHCLRSHSARNRLLLLLLKYDRSLGVAYACWTWKCSSTSIACKLKKIDAQTIGSEKPHRLMSFGELVFMAPPTMACDGPREDSIELVPVLFVEITNQLCVSWPRKNGGRCTAACAPQPGHRGSPGAQLRSTAPRPRCSEAALLSVVNQPEMYYLLLWRVVLLANQRRVICMSWVRAKIMLFLPAHT